MTLIKKLQQTHEELERTRIELERVQQENQQLRGMTRHLHFLDNALDGYFFTDEHHNVLFINQYLLEQLGYDPKLRYTLLGSPLPDQHWDKVDERAQLLDELWEREAVRERRIAMRTTNGTPLFFKISAVLTRDDTGIPLGAQYTLRSLAASRHRTTAELRAENRELAALSAMGRKVLSTMDSRVVVDHLISNLPLLFPIDAAWVYLREGTDHYRLAACHGLSTDQQALAIQGAPRYFDMMSKMDNTHPQLFGRHGPIPQSLSNVKQLGFERVALAALHARGETLGVLVIASRTYQFLIEPDLQSLERIVQYAALALSNAMLYQDLQGAYEELKHAQEQLVEAERQKVVVQMAGAAAHELNQPLTVLLGHANLLVRHMEPDNPYRSTFEVIERNTRKISEIVARLGKLARYRTLEYMEGEPILDLHASDEAEIDGLEDELG